MDVKKRVLDVRLRRLWVLLALLVTAVWPTRAQYYSWGSDAPMKWSVLLGDSLQIIAPDSALGVARRTYFYARSITPSIGYGFTRGPMRIPVVLHPQNFEANGIVIYLPKRIELRAIPETEGYSMPWIKHVMAHEYRHAVQYNNMNRGVFRVFNYLTGEHAAMASMLCMPLWALEGDAVMAETELSSFGRALQPSFTLEYRAMQRVGTDRSGTRYRSNTDKWFCGSYREMIPDHYRLGYQLNAYAESRYGEPIWDRIVRFNSRNPYMIFPTHVALKRYYHTSISRLFRETFDHLQQHWDSIPTPADSANPLRELPENNHTTYRWPLPIADTALLAVKEDFDRTTRFVLLDRQSGAERTVAYVGALSSRPVCHDGRVWWSEYRPSTLFEERVNSRLCYMDLQQGVPQTYSGSRNALYPVVVPHSEEQSELVWVEYDVAHGYAIVREDGTRHRVPVDKELHGLTWEEESASLYALVTDDSGMWIARIGEDGSLQAVTSGAYITLSNLRAGKGCLYFGSIASGRDEVHGLDLHSLCEYQISESAYGAFDGAPTAEGDTLLLTQYQRRGYAPAVQAITRDKVVRPSTLPENLVNPTRSRWPVMNLDTIRFTSQDSVAQLATLPARRYHKALHAIHVHSFLPVALDPFEAVDEHKIDLQCGVTLMSQNLLSNTESFASYGWSQAEGSQWRVALRYIGWGVKLGFRFDYGGNRQAYSLVTKVPETEEEQPAEGAATDQEEDTAHRGGVKRQPLPAAAKYLSCECTATLPLLFHSGYHIRKLSLSTAWNYSNSMIADLDAIRFDQEGTIVNIDSIGYHKGLHKLSFGVSYSDQVRQAYRDFAPRFGWMIYAGSSVNPTNADFSSLWALYGQLYVPGIGAHHSLKLAATWQNSYGGYRMPSGYRPLGFRSSMLIPNGFTSSEIISDHYRAASVDYQMPVWYPDGGIRSVLYFKRVRLNLGGQMAAYRMPDRTTISLWSVGADLIVDFNLFRLPASGTSTLRLSCYRPSKGGWWCGASLGLPF